MTTLYRWTASLVVGALTTAAAGAWAAPVVYTLRTVTDGQLGTHVFSEALVTIQMHSNTASLQAKPSVNNGTLYSNTGTTTVTITDGAWHRVATFANNEVFVFYDTGTGVAGFGSHISPTYPISLDCADYAYPNANSYTKDCQIGDWWDESDRHSGTLSALADPLAVAAGNGNDIASYNGYFPYLPPQSLVQSTLLTGFVHACATVYTIPSLPYSYLGVCAGPDVVGLKTDHGRLSFNDQAARGTSSNSGSLQVEVLTEH